MSAVPALIYCLGFPIIGFCWWLCNGIKGYFEHLAPDDVVTTYMNLIWLFILILYTLFAGIWLIRIYTEKQYQGG